MSEPEAVEQHVEIPPTEWALSLTKQLGPLTASLRERLEALGRVPEKSERLEAVQSAQGIAEDLTRSGALIGGHLRDEERRLSRRR